jgi:ElaB/YqjD/DUF883 family membrane-anchored ribosome-binding protein
MADMGKSVPASLPKHGEQPEKKATGLSGAVEGVKDTAKDVASAVGDAAGQAKDKVQEWSSAAVTQVKDTTQELASATADKAADFAKDLTQLVRRHPLQALLIGFGAGLLLGGLLGRGTRS